MVRGPGSVIFTGFDVNCFEVRYEDVVADLDTQVRRLLAFCGLPFEEACLRHPYKPRALRHFRGTLTDIRPQDAKPYYATATTD